MAPLIFAHRGASGDAPENTMAAFRLAIAQGAQGIELDIQMSKDGELVVIHDETLDRTTNGRGLVEKYTLKELSRFDAGHGYSAFKGERIPSLKEVMELIQPAGLELNIELKNSIIPYEGMEEKAVRMVREYGLEEQVVFSSFNHESVAKLARMAPEIETAILYSNNLPEPWAAAALCGAKGIHPPFDTLDRKIVEYTHRAGLNVRPWTVNKETDIIHMIELGVDAVITNYPARMKAILADKLP